MSQRITFSNGCKCFSLGLGARLFLMNRDFDGRKGRPHRYFCGFIHKAELANSVRPRNLPAIQNGHFLARPDPMSP